MSKNEFRDLLGILRYYLIGGLGMGIAISSLAVAGGIVLLKPIDGLLLSPRAITAMIVLLLGVMTGLLAFLVLLPAELKLMRREAAVRLYAQRMSRKR